MEEIKVKYFQEDMEELCYVAGKSDWIDLRAAQEVSLKAGEFRLIPLGVAIALPQGYEAHIAPRSSTSRITAFCRPTLWAWWTAPIAAITTSGICPSTPRGT